MADNQRLNLPQNDRMTDREIFDELVGIAEQYAKTKKEKAEKAI